MNFKKASERFLKIFKIDKKLRVLGVFFNKSAKKELKSA